MPHFNFFLDVLESGRMVSSQALEIDINGFIIIFTSNIAKEETPVRISPELRSKFDYKGHFTRLSNQDKRKYVEYSINSIIRKYNEHYNKSLGTEVINYFIKTILSDKYENMRDINKAIKIEFVKYIRKQNRYHKARISLPKYLKQKLLQKRKTRINNISYIQQCYRKSVKILCVAKTIRLVDDLEPSKYFI